MLTERERVVFSGSIGMPRPDAWRCMGQPDPRSRLQAPEGAAPLICIVGAKAIRLRLTKALLLSAAEQGGEGVLRPAAVL